MLNFYKNKKILITGHTGFKGAWLSFWLDLLGAKVCGYALKPTTTCNLYSILKLEDKIQSVIDNILNRKKLDEVVQSFQPDMIFHLAAQPLVRESYFEPVLTYETNIIGTLNVFESARRCPTVKAVVNITTDKCYENQEKQAGYKEEEPMGGYDMYSSSKACSEILTSSYRRSFLKEGHPFGLASVRAGNVIGGGDWSKDRLIPDCIQSLIEQKPIIMRYPLATRPWQHVLEPLWAYMVLGKNLFEKPISFAQAYNIGPDSQSVIKVGEIVQKVVNIWGSGEVKFDKKDDLHEAVLLQLDNTKAKQELGIFPVMQVEEALKMTVEWYQKHYENQTDMQVYSKNQITQFMEKVNMSNIKNQ